MKTYMIVSEIFSILPEKDGEKIVLLAFGEEDLKEVLKDFSDSEKVFVFSVDDAIDIKKHFD